VQSQYISEVEGNLLSKSDKVKALCLCDACSETKHQKDKKILLRYTKNWDTQRKICISNGALSKNTKGTDFAIKTNYM
jgi:hypothetical protein